MIRGRVSKFTNQDIAAAMELYDEVPCWKRIERAYGDGLYQAVRDAKRRGMHKR